MLFLGPRNPSVGSNEPNGLAEATTVPPNQDFWDKAAQSGKTDYDAIAEQARRTHPATVEDLGRGMKAKYPGAYDDLTDADLGRRVKAKYPGSYGDFVDVIEHSKSAKVSSSSRFKNVLQASAVVIAPPAIGYAILFMLLPWIRRGFA